MKTEDLFKIGDSIAHDFIIKYEYPYEVLPHIRDIILEIGRAINIYATNALRATGDVNFPFYVGVVVQWGVAVGCGYLFGLHWGWGLIGMWFAFLLDENIRGIIFVRRWNSLKWAKKSFVK